MPSAAAPAGKVAWPTPVPRPARQLRQAMEAGRNERFAAAVDGAGLYRKGGASVSGDIWTSFVIGVALSPQKRRCVPAKQANQLITINVLLPPASLSPIANDSPGRPAQH
jgi:hypothetical protein